MSSDFFVYKFGGSSVKNAKTMEACANVVKSEPSVKIIIVSATYNTTNELETIAMKASDSGEASLADAKELWHQLVARHEQISKDLNVESRFEHFLSLINAEALETIQKIHECGSLTLEMMDQFYSLGERLSSRLIMKALTKSGIDNAEFVDVRDVLSTNSDFSKAIPNIEKIKNNATEKLIPLIKAGKIIVTQGFIGRDEEGRTTTLGREGSDFSATLLAEATGANKVGIWTDVPGVFTVDPRLYDKARSIKEMSYEAASEMARLGSKVLFSQTLDPAKRVGIPVFVGATLKPQLGGTIISKLVDHSGLVGMSYEDGVLSLIGHDLDPSLIDLPLIENSSLSLQYQCSEEKLSEFLEFIHSHHLP